MLVSVAVGVEVCLGLRGESCLGIWLGLGILVEVTTEGWRQGAGLWGLLMEGIDVARRGGGGKGVSACEVI